jgi:predicted dehydrogenase
MTAPVRIGFLGAGLIATYHSKSLRRSGARVERAGVYDPDPERATQFAELSGHTVCATEADVLDGCDAVYVCTWTNEHRRLVEAAVARGKHVFCEKPLAHNADEAAAMAALVRNAGVVAQVGLVLRHSPAYLWARHLITDSEAGRVMTVVFRDDQFIPIQGHYSSTWRGDRTKAGAGTLIEHSIHDVDMLHFLVGPIVAVNARTASFHGIEGIEDLTATTFRFADGALGTLTSVWHDNLARPSLRRVEVFCERRHVVIDGDDWFGPVNWTDSDGGGGALDGSDLVAAVLPMRDGPDNPDGAFVAAIIEGTKAHPDLDVAVAAHRVVDAMYASAAVDGATVLL